MLASGRTARDEKRERNATTPDDEAREREERSPPRVTQAHSRSSGRKLTLTRLRVGFYARVLASGSTGLVRPFPTLCSLGAPGSSLRSARQLASPGACRHLDANPTISSPLHVASSYIHVVHPTTSDWGTAVSGLAGEGTSPTRSDIPHLPHPIRRSSLWNDITYILLLHPTTLRQHPHYKQLRVPWFVRRPTDRQASGITPLVAAG